MAVTREATLKVLRQLGLHGVDARILVDTATENGSADGYADYEPLAGILITVHHAGSERYTTEIH